MGQGCKRMVLIVVAAMLSIGAFGARDVGAQTSAEKMRAMVTQSREDRGLHELGGHWALKELAKRQARRMRDAGTIFHNHDIADELNAMTRDWTMVGENVGMGPAVTDIENAFMRSKSHKQNILGTRWNAMAIGVEKDANGRFYIAQVFATMSG